MDGRIALRNFKEGGKTRVLSPGYVVSDGKDGFRNSAKDKKLMQEIVARTKKTLIGEDLAVSDLVDEFRYIYGKRIVVSHTALLKRKIDGRVFLKSEESIIYSIANILQANIRVKKYDLP